MGSDQHYIKTLHGFFRYKVNRKSCFKSLFMVFMFLAHDKQFVQVCSPNGKKSVDNQKVIK